MRRRPGPAPHVLLRTPSAPALAARLGPAPGRFTPSAILATLVALAPAARAGLPATPVELWRWEGQVESPERPWPTIAIAVPLTDEDGDGDADADDGPDVVFLHQDEEFERFHMTMTALEGRTGEILWSVSDPPFGSAFYENSTGALAGGDIDGDGFAELLVTYREESFPEHVPAQLRAFEHDGTHAWSRDWPGTVNNSGQALGLADMNQDGTVEAYLLANVLSVDGSVSWSNNIFPGTREWTAFSLVADIDPDVAGLELLYGGNLFNWRGANLWGDFFRPMGPAGIGDLDGDGDAEIAVIQDSLLYLYDHRGGELEPPIYTGPSSPWGARPSSPVIADVDGDGLDEIVFSNNVRLIAYGFDGTSVVEEWDAPITDHSGVCGPTAFDFDGDGAAEVIHRDEGHWYVLEGADGTVLHQERFPSRTGSESPIVVDLGQGCGAAIIVTGFGDIPSDDADAVDAVIAYHVPGSSTPRRIWNQRTYHVTNVDENGAIPQFEQAPWEIGVGWQAQSGVPTETSGISFDTAWVEDPDDCRLGLVVSWAEAVPDDPSVRVVYDVHRSDALPSPDCGDALAQPPLASGLTGLTWTDGTTEAGRSYVYAVRARVDSLGACAAPAEACTAPITEVGDPRPDGVYDTLRARHVGDDVTVTWDDARTLLAGEHFHLLKTVGAPTSPFVRVNPESDLARAHAERDVGSPLQFFDLRVANRCEVQSPDEYPAGR